MQTARLATLAAALLVLAAAPARADGFISPFIGYNFGGDSQNCVSLTNCDERRTNWGGLLAPASHNLPASQKSRPAPRLPDW